MSGSGLVLDAAVLRARRQWHYTGRSRPTFAVEPRAGQESVWDYPRPPRIAPESRRVEVRFGDELIADSERAVRVLETASPPTFYLPPSDVAIARLVPSGGRSMCEWKGVAIDFDLAAEPVSAGPTVSASAASVDSMASVAWCYERTFPEFAAIEGWFSFYPARLDCRVAGEGVRPQPGGYYGGWITNEIVGPVKGEPGCRAS